MLATNVTYLNTPPHRRPLPLGHRNKVATYPVSGHFLTRFLLLLLYHFKIVLDKDVTLTFSQKDDDDADDVVVVDDADDFLPALASLKAFWHFGLARLCILGRKKRTQEE